VCVAAEEGEEEGVGVGCCRRKTPRAVGWWSECAALYDAVCVAVHVAMGVAVRVAACVLQRRRRKRKEWA